jgi:phospholipid transport system substrate-binding protein
MSFHRPLRLLVLVVGLGLAASGAEAAAGTAAGFIKNLVDTAIAALANKQMSEGEREKTFHQLLDQDFDMPVISRFVLGRHWNNANAQEKQRFLDLFEEYVVRSYAQRFSQYSGETVKISGSRPESETTTLVRSEVLRTNGAPPAKVDWRVRQTPNGYKIVDVEVEGVSMVLTQREEFASVIDRAGGIAGLNKELAEKLASGNASLQTPLPKN